MEEASSNLAAPETAPVAAPPPERQAPQIVKVQRNEGREPVRTTHTRAMDGRSARRTNRTIQFATRVSPEFDQRIREISQRDGLLLVEVMEMALEAYESRSKVAAR